MSAIEWATLDAGQQQAVRDALAKLADERRRPECSGISASWCAVHGDCTCPRLEDGDFFSMDSDDCPLHNMNSTHAEPVAPSSPDTENSDKETRQ